MGRAIRMKKVKNEAPSSPPNNEEANAAESARAAYATALATNGNSSFLKMKHDDLAPGEAK